MGFHDVRFPDAIARGATGGPEYSTDIIAVASGFEQRNINWQAARARYDIGTGIRTREQMAEVIAFELEIRGSHGMQAFRYQAMMEMIRSGKLAPQMLVGKRLSLAEAPQALMAMDRFEGTGIGVVTSF